MLEYPGSSSVLLISLVMFVFFCGKTWERMGMMWQRLEQTVTLDDLNIAILKLKEELSRTYVTKEDCGFIERGRDRD